jgi:predicted aspartyl protease
MQYRNWYGIVLMAYALFMAGFCQAQPTLYYEIPHSAKTLDAATHVKLHKTSSSHIVVKVKLNGQGPFKFLIDTGASHSVISERLAKKLNLKPIHVMKFKRSDTIFKANVYRFDTINLGDAQINQYDMVVYPEPSFISYLKTYFKEDIDGIFGFGAFYHYLWTLNLSKKEMSLVNGQLNAKEKDVLKFAQPEKIPLVTVDFKDNKKQSKRLNFVIDTGSNEEFTLPPGVLNLPFKKMSTKTIKSGTHFGEFTAKKDKIHADVYWGSKIIKNPTVVYNKAMYDANLPFGLMGILALEKTRITFDQKQNLLQLQSF